jgi:hypothetical protein
MLNALYFLVPIVGKPLATRLVTARANCFLLFVDGLEPACEKEVDWTLRVNHGEEGRQVSKVRTLLLL